MPRPDLQRVPAFFHGYINDTSEEEMVLALQNSTESFLSFLKTIPPEKHDYRYAEDKWTIKELLQHVIDTERIFAYRALRFARKDDTPLSGFNENLFAKNAKAEKRQWEDMVSEFSLLRKVNEMMYASFDEEQLESTGISNNHPVYVRAMGFISAGHVNHHLKIIKERYL
jgi:hypothetical protein